MRVFKEILARIPTVLVGYEADTASFYPAREAWLNGECENKELNALFNRCVSRKRPWTQALVAQSSAPHRIHVVNNAEGGLIRFDYPGMSWVRTAFKCAPITTALLPIFKNVWTMPVLNENYPILLGVSAVGVATVSLMGYVDRVSKQRPRRLRQEKQVKRLTRSILKLRQSYLDQYGRDKATPLPRTLLVVTRDRGTPAQIVKRLAEHTSF